MKKLIVLAICMVVACFALVGCDDVIGEDLPGYLEDMEAAGGNQQAREEVELDLYIITDDATQTVATKTVNQAIDKFTSDKYKVRLDIKYLKASEYKATVLNDIAKTDAEKPDIVLINSKELYDDLMTGGHLAALDAYLDSDTITSFKNISKNIPKIKKDIPDCLWNAIADTQDSGTYFAVPNNREIGEYKYLKINRADFFAKSYSELLFEEAGFDPNEFMLTLQNDSVECSIVTGKYSDMENDKADNLCVVLEKPTVDAEYAFESAFAVVSGTGLEARAMEIIYALNTEKQLRNLLQYGDVLTHYNYVLDGEGKKVTDKNGVPYIAYNTGAEAEIYRMNLLYTGNIFTADYCDELDWNYDARVNAEAHNKDAVFVPEEPAEP